MNERDLSPIFIGGHRKCGTTMLLNLLDNHPELCVYPVDLTILYAYFPIYDNENFSICDRKKRLDTVIFKHLESHEKVKNNWNISEFRELFFKRMEAKQFIIGDILEQLLFSYHDQISCSGGMQERIVAKETSIEIYASILFERFPNAKFIHLIRDPRDNFGALKSGIEKWYSKFNDDDMSLLHSLLERCLLGMNLAKENQVRFGCERYHIIKFEDLVTAPAENMDKICQFLEIKFNQTMTVPTFLGLPTRGNNFDGHDFSQISSINVGKWRERILDEEAMTIEFHFRHLMKQFGYDCFFSHAEQADAATDFYKWSNSKYHYSERFRE